MPDSLPFMGFTSCQLACPANAVPRNPGWIFERKYDGYRAQAVVRGSDVRLFTRNGLDWTTKLASLVSPLAALTRGSAALDGEICAVMPNGRTDFSLLCSSIHNGTPLVFFAFDLLEQDGVDLRGRPLIERKAALARLLGNRDVGSPLQMVDYLTSNGDQLLEQMRSEGHEGIVAKRMDGPYRPGRRSPDWLKVKCIMRQEFAVIGWQADQKEGWVKSLAIATLEQGRFSYRGRVGTGFSRAQRGSLAMQLRDLEAPLPACPSIPESLRPQVRWLRPYLVAEVAYAEISPRGIVRHPSFVGLRADKTVEQTALETPLSQRPHSRDVASAVHHAQHGLSAKRAEPRRSSPRRRHPRHPTLASK